MSLFHVTVDTGDGYYGHSNTWTVEIDGPGKTSLNAWLRDLKKIGAIESFDIRALSAANSLVSVKPKIQAWIKANPKGRTYGGPGAGR